MKKVLQMSSLYVPAGPAAGTFGAFFRNLTAGVNLCSERSGWKAVLAEGTAPRRLSSGVASPFDAPSFTGDGLGHSLELFQKRMDLRALIRANSSRLGEYSGIIAEADIFHAHDPFAALAFMRGARKDTAAKLCLTPGYLSGLDASGSSRPWLREIEDEALSLADFLMVPSRSYLSALEKVYGPFQKRHVVLPGLEDGNFIRSGVLRDRLGVPRSALLAAAFYGPGASPDAEFFIESFARARHKAPGRLFGVIAGVRSRALEDRVMALGIKDSFFLLEPGAPEWDVLSEADIFFSAFRRPAVELGTIGAFCAGLAVAASDEDWNAEVSGYGEAALLFRAGDADSAGAALAELAGRPPALIHFSAKAREYFKARYSIGALGVRAAAAYSEMAGVGAAERQKVG